MADDPRVEPVASFDQRAAWAEGYNAGNAAGVSSAFREVLLLAKTAVEESVHLHAMKPAYREGALWAADFIARPGAVPALSADVADPLRALLADEDRAVKRLRFAIADPGSFLARGDNYAEPITSWSARAVLAALREAAGL